MFSTSKMNNLFCTAQKSWKLYRFSYVSLKFIQSKATVLVSTNVGDNREYKAAWKTMVDNCFIRLCEYCEDSSLNFWANVKECAACADDRECANWLSRRWTPRHGHTVLVELDLDPQKSSLLKWTHPVCYRGELLTQLHRKTRLLWKGGLGCVVVTCHGRSPCSPEKVFQAKFVGGGPLVLCLQRHPLWKSSHHELGCLVVMMEVSDTTRWCRGGGYFHNSITDWFRSIAGTPINQGSWITAVPWTVQWRRRVGGSCGVETRRSPCWAWTRISTYIAIFVEIWLTKETSEECQNKEIHLGSGDPDPNGSLTLASARYGVTWERACQTPQ